MLLLKGQTQSKIYIQHQILLVIGKTPVQRANKINLICATVFIEWRGCIQSKGHFLWKPICALHNRYFQGKIAVTQVNFQNTQKILRYTEIVTIKSNCLYAVFVLDSVHSKIKPNNINLIKNTSLIMILLPLLAVSIRLVFAFYSF